MAVDHVLIRYFRYSDRIQENIEAKKLQDQLVFTNEAERKAAVQEQELNRERKQGEMQVEITLEEGKAFQVKKEAEKEFYVRKKEAEADLLVELAEAKRVEMRNRAMQELGADRKVAMQMAEVLKGLEALVIPVGTDDMPNPLNLDSILSSFGVRDYDAGETAGVAMPPALDSEEGLLSSEALPRAIDTTAPEPEIEAPEPAPSPQPTAASPPEASPPEDTPPPPEETETPAENNKEEAAQ